MGNVLRRDLSLILETNCFILLESEFKVYAWDS